MKFSYYSPHLEILWKLLKSNHIDPSTIFSKYGLKYKDIKDPDRRTPVKLIPKLWDEASNKIANPNFGLEAYKFWHPGYLGALGYAWLNSNTLRECFTRLSRYISMLSNVGQIKIEEKNQHYQVVLVHEQLGINTARSDNALSILIHMARINYQDPLNPIQVTFTHTEPENSGDYFSYFKSSVLFNQSFDSFMFPVDVIDEPLPAGNKQLAEINDRIIIQYLKGLNNESLEQQVKQIIAQKLPSGVVTGEIVADELSISHRTLQRKLKELHTSFKILLEESRRTLAQKYISEGKVSVTELTFMLGFGEVSSFSRAYKRWTGHSPRTEKTVSKL